MLVRSDHGALPWIFNFKNPEGQLARWLETLSTYNFKIEYRGSRVHSNAVGLSRRPCCDSSCNYSLRAETRYKNSVSEEQTIIDPESRFVKTCNSQDKTINISNHSVNVLLGPRQCLEVRPS